MYIQAPYIPKAITITKEKVKRIKPAKWDEVPKDYRSKRIAKRRAIMSEIPLLFIGLADFMRKEDKV